MAVKFKEALSERKTQHRSLPTLMNKDKRLEDFVKTNHLYNFSNNDFRDSIVKIFENLKEILILVITKSQ